MVAFKSLFVIALPMLALASPLVERTDSCNSGSVQCCNEVASSTSSDVTSLAGLMGILLNVGELVGIHCTNLPLGIAGNSCNEQTVCCTGNNFNGLIVAGCSPFNVGL